MIGWAVRQAAIWVVLGLLFFAVIANLPSTKNTPAPPSDTAVATAPVRSGNPNSLVFRANKQGHVVLDGFVNGAAVRFLVDTGASMVVLTPRDAAAAGFGPNDLNFTLQTSTANGIARAAPIRLREIRIGQLSVNDVPAAVVERLNISLLGQTFLKRLDSYEMHNGVLTLNYW